MEFKKKFIKNLLCLAAINHVIAPPKRTKANQSRRDNVQMVKHKRTDSDELLDAAIKENKERRTQLSTAPVKSQDEKSKQTKIAMELLELFAQHFLDKNMNGILYMQKKLADIARQGIIDYDLCSICELLSNNCQGTAQQNAQMLKAMHTYNFPPNLLKFLHKVFSVKLGPDINHSDALLTTIKNRLMLSNSWQVREKVYLEYKQELFKLLLDIKVCDLVFVTECVTLLLEFFRSDHTGKYIEEIVNVLLPESVSCIESCMSDQQVRNEFEQRSILDDNDRKKIIRLLIFTKIFAIGNNDIHFHSAAYNKMQAALSVKTKDQDDDNQAVFKPSVDEVIKVFFQGEYIKVLAMIDSTLHDNKLCSTLYNLLSYYLISGILERQYVNAMILCTAWYMDEMVLLYKIWVDIQSVQLTSVPEVWMRALVHRKSCDNDNYNKCIRTGLEASNIDALAFYSLYSLGMSIQQVIALYGRFNKGWLKVLELSLSLKEEDRVKVREFFLLEKENDNPSHDIANIDIDQIVIEEVNTNNVSEQGREAEMLLVQEMGAPAAKAYADDSAQARDAENDRDMERLLVDNVSEEAALHDYFMLPSHSNTSPLSGAPAAKAYADDIDESITATHPRKQLIQESAIDSDNPEQVSARNKVSQFCDSISDRKLMQLVESSPHMSLSRNKHVIKIYDKRDSAKPVITMHVPHGKELCYKIRNALLNMLRD